LPASNFEEGLSGQAFKSGKIIHLKKLPETYIKVKSALGSSNRANLILIPLKNAGSPIGLLEIIAFQDFKQYEIDFIETVSEIIGSVVDSSISLSKSTRHRK
jgi:transcriptional regulator with GAF, ATPase, and Fis domain